MNMESAAQAAEAAGRKQMLLGITAGIVSYGLWALNVVYFRQLEHVDLLEFVAHRSVWSFVLMVGLVTLMRRWQSVIGHIRNPKTLRTLALTGFLIGSNWLFLIWMTNANRVVEASLGQFVVPLGSVLAGVIFLRERPTRPQTLALLCAGVGVAYFCVNLGYVPWFAIYLPASFVAYTYLRKTMNVDALDGLFVELLILVPFAIAYLAYLGGDVVTTLTVDYGWTAFLLVCAGPITVAPLVLFVYSAKHVSMMTLGFLQYIVPSGTFLFGVLLFNEPLTQAHLVTFGFIWIGLIIFSADAWRRERALRNEAAGQLG